MSNVFELFHLAGRVEITSGIVQSATITDHTGTRAVLSDVGRFFYFVDVIDSEGGRLAMWHGPERAEAIRQANELASDWGIPGRVRDLSEHPA